MPIITVKVEDELKSQVAAVVDELGLDIPTAIRMYLKAIVRENGLPFNTKLASASESDFGISGLLPADNLLTEEPGPASDVSEEQIENTVPDTEPIEAIKPVIDYDTRSGRKAIANLFIGEICSVPAGSLTRWKDVETKLSAQYGTEVTRPQNVRWPATVTMPDGTEIKIPYWRIVSERGAVRGDKMIEQAAKIAPFAPRARRNCATLPDDCTTS
jgi:addiction module antitoxin, RelB/DinJ family